MTDSELNRLHEFIKKKARQWAFEKDQAQVEALVEFLLTGTTTMLGHDIDTIFGHKRNEILVNL